MQPSRTDELSRFGVDVQEHFDEVRYILPAFPGRAGALAHVIGTGLVALVSTGVGLYLLVDHTMWILAGAVLSVAGTTGWRTWSATLEWLGQTQEVRVGTEQLVAIRRCGPWRARQAAPVDKIQRLLLLDAAALDQPMAVSALCAEVFHKAPIDLATGHDVAMTKALAAELAERIASAARSLGVSHEVPVVRLDAERWLRKQVLQPPHPDIDVREQAAGVQIVFPAMGWRTMGGTLTLLILCSVLVVPVLLLAAGLGFYVTPELYAIGVVAAPLLIMMASAIYALRQRLGAIDHITINSNRLTIERQGNHHASHCDVDLTAIEDLALKPAHRGGHKLRIKPNRGRTATCLAGRRETEVQWVVAVVMYYQEANLHSDAVPASPSQPADATPEGAA